MTVVKANTRKGQELINNAKYNEGYDLKDVYKKASKRKKEAWDRCFSMYCATDNLLDFHITSHNTFMFCVAWTAFEDGHEYLFYITSKTDYKIILD